MLKSSDKYNITSLAVTPLVMKVPKYCSNSVCESLLICIHTHAVSEKVMRKILAEKVNPLEFMKLL